MGRLKYITLDFDDAEKIVYDQANFEVAFEELTKLLKKRRD